MRAVVIAEHGASPDLSQIPAPEPGADEVLVRVEASSVNGFAAVAADAAGRITIPIHRTYPLSEVPATFDDFAAGARGKLAITLA